jgi:hypothetical protein
MLKDNLSITWGCSVPNEQPLGLLEKMPKSSEKCLETALNAGLYSAGSPQINVHQELVKEEAK